MSESPQNPNVATLQTGLGRSSRRTGNRLDRYAERVWMTRQMVTFPYGAVPIWPMYRIGEILVAKAAS